MTAQEMFIKGLSAKITSKIITKIILELEELEANNKSEIISWGFDVDKMNLYGEFENGLKFEKEIELK